MNEELINLIPKMTSNSAPNGIVECSSEWNGRYGYYAFDQVPTTMWTNSSGTEAFISYEFETPTKVNLFKILHGDRSVGEQYIYWNKCDIYGDDELLTTINKSDVVVIDRICTFQKELNTNKAYKKYTFKFDTSTYTYITAIELYYIPSYKYLIKQNNTYYSLTSSFHELGQPQGNIELEKWYNDEGVDNLNILCTNKELLPQIKETIGSKFQIAKWEEK